jgi:hypothetical protein
VPSVVLGTLTVVDPLCTVTPGVLTCVPVVEVLVGGGVETLGVVTLVVVEGTVTDGVVAIGVETAGTETDGVVSVVVVGPGRLSASAVAAPAAESANAMRTTAAIRLPWAMRKRYYLEGSPVKL